MRFRSHAYVVPTGCGESNLTRADRKLRQQLRRSGCGKEVVRGVEEGLVEFLGGSGSQLKEKEEDDVRTVTNGEAGSDSDASGVEGWVKVKTTHVGKEEKKQTDSASEADLKAVLLALDLTDSFARNIVHAMCRYYLLVSHSEDRKDGQRITYVRKPDLVDGKRRHALPEVSFYDFCFS
ncbi:hypothetical protein HK097_002538 [Rhizophlyctis rosea]|uniref:Uncharacterized protein n=1 Tax=Rhizophlyctis rosea TaxID=64517 RepID=A0AAD5S4Q0_9FUNG|nr:hypothetical protein HK097_002538 [Rhizophlyctis rosea]